MPMPPDLKVRENRLRRIAERRGYRLSRSNRRDPAAIDYGRYMVIDDVTLDAVLGGRPRAYSASLEDVEAFFAVNKEDR